MPQSQNNDEVNELVARLGRDLCGMRQKCFNRFAGCLPLLRLWSRQALENLANEKYRLINDFETKNKHNGEKVNTTVEEARKTFPALLRAFQKKISQFLSTGQTPSRKELREIKLTFGEFNPKFDSIRKIALQSDETPPAIRQLFLRHDEIRGSIVEMCAPLIKNAAYRVVKRSLQEDDRNDLLSNATLIAMIALDRYDAEHDEGLQAFIAKSVKTDTISFMRRLGKALRSPSIFDLPRDAEGPAIVEALPNKKAHTPDEIAEENEIKNLMIEQIAECADDPDVRLFLRYRGVPDGKFNLISLDALLEGYTGQTTYKKLAEEESVTPQAIQKRCKRGIEKIKEVIGDAYESDNDGKDNDSSDRQERGMKSDNATKGYNAPRITDRISERRAHRKSLKRAVSPCVP